MDGEPLPLLWNALKQYLMEPISVQSSKTMFTNLLKGFQNYILLNSLEKTLKNDHRELLIPGGIHIP